MGKHPHAKASKGSEKHIQTLVNAVPELLNKQIAENISQSKPLNIEWVSPLKPAYHEYSDADFLNVLGLSAHVAKLKKFWPNGGPNWDALGKAGSGEIFLVEAKAHIDEIVSPATAAKSLSKKRIIASLNLVKKFLGIKDNQPWHGKFYQYANRIAHLYFLRVICRVDAYLIFLNFLNDDTRSDVPAIITPKTKDEWVAATRVVENYLSVRGTKLSKYIIHAYVDVQKLTTP